MYLLNHIPKEIRKLLSNTRNQGSHLCKSTPHFECVGSMLPFLHFIPIFWEKYGKSLKPSYTFSSSTMCRKISRICRKVSSTISYFPEFVGKFAVLFLFSRMCVTIIIEIFGTHLKFFLENEPAVYGFTGAKTGSTFRFLFLLEHVLSYLPQKTRFQAFPIR